MSDFTDSFEPLEELEGPIVLQIRGKSYELPIVSLEAGLKLQKLSAENNSEDMASVLLGDVGKQMEQDGVSMPILSRAYAVAFTDWRFGRDLAKRVWREGPKALIDLSRQMGQMLAEAREKAEAESTATETPSDEAATTPRRASGSGTRSRKTPSRGPKS